MNKKAFTMIELVFVIVLIGILAALAIPRQKRDLRQEAADNILSAIRYTQHLALMDDKQKFNKAKWQRRFWRIYFGTCENKIFYAIGSDDNMDGSTNARVDHNESALDPANGKLMWAEDNSCTSGTLTMSDLSPNIMIGKKYGITTITPTGGCSNSYIGFDHLGRPYGSSFVDSTMPNDNGILTSDCDIKFSSSDNAFTPFHIIIKKETGYAYIDGEPNS